MFQKTIQNKYIKAQGDISEKWELFKNHFHNPSVQENIRNSKEEQYQEGFFRDLFVNILGYTLNPDKDFNLTTELKNEKDSKKADGGILSPSNEFKPIGIIELKGTNTTDLGKVENQAFGYKHNHRNCLYVIISNFEKLRFYIDNAINHIEFNLFTLTEDEFKLLYLLLSLNSITNDIPKKLKAESISQEDVITKKLYKDYSVFKRELFANLCALNTEIDKLILFKKSQKLLDRFLFLFFAEDSYLLPPNSVREVLKQWGKLKELDAYTPLYERFKKYFGYLNTGYKGKKHDIFAYNGGLFKPDEILDTVKIDDEILYKHTKTLSEYDFNSEVDVNILGHIFENSLNEIEEIEAQLKNSISLNKTPPMGLNKRPPMGLNPLESSTPLESSKTGLNQTSPMGSNQTPPMGLNKTSPMGLNPLEDSNPLGGRKVSKRKKDGVFYTPKYITQYIVENTVGKLCNDKKEELNIIEEEYFKGINPLGRKRNKKTITHLLQKLKDYRAWLLELTICDPACGSGAFLNEALNFLIAEHKYLDELETKLLGGGFIFPNIKNSILENNIFGVDINEESVEIAKLSLWLRTAQPNRKLNNLNENIKCGNSLIDDTAIAGEKAFNWQQEFPKVFKEKLKEAYHVVLTTHNSRTSQRMIDLNIKKGKPFNLDLKQEIALSEIMGGIIKDNAYNCIAYNICKDHVHLILVCEEDELTNIVKTIKGKSSFMFQSNGFKPIGKPLWSQKFFYADLDTWTFSGVSKRVGYCINDDYIDRAINYIKTNRQKHELTESKKLNDIIADFVQDIDTAFAPEYKGGFDVVIGNPPYVRIQGLQDAYPEMVRYYDKTFKSATGNYDIYALFMERCFDLINDKGVVSFILPHKFLVTDFGVGIRGFFKEKNAVKSIVHFGSEMVFSDASTYTCIIDFDKNTKDQVLFKKIKPAEIQNDFEWDYMLYDNLSEQNWDLQSQKTFDIIEKLKTQPYTIDDVFDKIFQGIASGGDKFFTLKLVEDKGNVGVFYSAMLEENITLEFDLLKPFVKGNQISKYQTIQNTLYTLFPYELINNKAKPLTFKFIEQEFPLIANYYKRKEDLTMTMSGFFLVEVKEFQK